ncbi:MAG: multidrug efflux SMR transporter [Epulopiscium sp.]|nr:multidrug efflux SMR transporter [Candidatus Epulonipiscium sp.]
MQWVFLLVAGIFEVVWATCLKFSHGFSKLNYSIYTIIGMIISFYFLSQATKTLPIGTAYAIWTGIGAIGATIVGVLLFHESMTLIRGFFVVLLLTGIIGLKITSS